MLIIKLSLVILLPLLTFQALANSHEDQATQTEQDEEMQSLYEICVDDAYNQKLSGKEFENFVKECMGEDTSEDDDF